jgi:hypothetical protein
VSQISTQKPVNPPIPNAEAAATTAVLQALALASLVRQNGGKMTFPLSDLHWIETHTLGLNAEIFSSQHTPEKFLILTTLEEPKGAAAVQ